MTNSLALRIAAVLGFLAVAPRAHSAPTAQGSAGAEPDRCHLEKAVFYHFIHAVMLFVLAGRVPVQTGPLALFLPGNPGVLRVALRPGLH